jgi:hypothetical protein
MLKEIIIVLKMFGKLLLLLFYSFVLTLLSSNYVTTGIVSRAGGLGPCGYDIPCDMQDVEVLTGGFPLQYLYDSLSSSVIGVLTLGDTIHGDIFLIDLTFYLIILLLIQLLINYKKA